MAYINSGNDQLGIAELLKYKPSVGRILSNLAHAILIEDSPLSSGERELIASYVSYLNDCKYCYQTHLATANELLEDKENSASSIIINPESADISDKMKSLLSIAKKVQKGGNLVSKKDIELAKSNGANDEAIHDTVLIASAFCMFNRYVDGLGTNSGNIEDYKKIGKRLTKGYKMS